MGLLPFRAGRGAGLSLRHRRSQGAAVRLFAALDLFEIEFHGRRAPEDRYRHLDLGLVEIEFLDGAVEARERAFRSEEHTSELQSLMRISYAVFCLKKKKKA